MPQSLASDMVRKSLDVFLERVAQPPRFSTDDAREVLASCAIPLGDLDHLWQVAQGFLDRGMERRRLVFFLKEYQDVLQLAIRAFGLAHERIQAADFSPDERANGIAMLDGARQRAADHQREVAALLRWLETPPREIAPMSLPAGREHPESSGYLRLDELTARLLDGDP